jgi:hypothetical protein
MGDIMRHFFATTLIAAAFAVTGCAASSDSDLANDTELTGEQSSEISAWGRKLIGAWEIQTGYSFEFDDLVLKSDGTYFWHRNIICKTAPCPTDSAGTYTTTAPSWGTVQGKLRLKAKGVPAVDYVVVQGYDGSIKIARGAEYGKFSSRLNYCQVATQCAGQPNDIMIKCAAGYHSEPVCTDTNACSKTCVADVPVLAACKPTGCSGQICSDKSIITTCEFRSEYACYQTAICERGTDGACGWRKTPALTECLANKGLPACKRTGCSGQVCSDTDVMTTCEYRAEYACYADATCARDAAGTCGWVQTTELTNCLASGGGSSI